MAPMLLAASVVAIEGTAAGSGPVQPAGPPDTFVADWDAVGTQAFTAAALTPAEGHTIFAYVAVAVYDSVIAIEGGYEPFAVDVDAPRTHRRRRRWRPPPIASSSTTCRRSSRRSSIRPTRPRWRRSLTARPKTNGVAVGEQRRRSCSSRSGRATASGHR